MTCVVFAAAGFAFADVGNSCLLLQLTAIMVESDVITTSDEITTRVISDISILYLKGKNTLA